MSTENNFIPKTIVIGHKHPDTDSMVSAVAYAEFKEKLGSKNIIAGRAGFPNARTEFLFKKFKIPLPELIQDVIPDMADLMNSDKISLNEGTVLLEAVESLQQQRVSRLPFVNSKEKFIGMISTFDIMNKLFSVRTKPSGKAVMGMLERKVTTSLSLAAKILNAEIINIHEDKELKDLYVYVAAQGLYSFRQRIMKRSPDSLAIVVGDRDDIQFMSVMELGVKLLIVTGNGHINETVIATAKEKKTTIFRTAFDSATAVRRLKFSEPVEFIIQKNQTAFKITDKVTEVRHKILSSFEDLFPVVDDNGTLLGTVSKRDMDDTKKIRLIMVDHNNLKQAVDGANEAVIVEILDHHHLDYPTTSYPITVTNDVVGSTCTLVTEKYKYMNIKPSKNMAGLLMGAIIDDTLFLKSPTSTTRDKDAIDWLHGICKVSPEQLASELFGVGSVIANNLPEKVLVIDKKNYNVGKHTYSIAQVEEANFNNFNLKFEDLLTAANALIKKESLSFFALIVTNLSKETSLMLASGTHDFMELLPYNKIKDNLYDLPGILSRKKQLLPQLINVFHPLE
ncbi:MAG TPA: putative manganese-dependent inorganic diphosphatase [Lentisphaeria bacterium]|nr:MAG: hypothetical protein A2X47_10520 [Lentisphaerae bacterium GWF2_38_69]HBM15020.1 putative manganese-dependent inorganic diphosphatase [Lentisphaeria bacterium]